MARTTRTMSTTIVAALLAAAVGGTYLATDYVNENLSYLTIQKLPHATVTGASFDTKTWLQTLAPVLVESRKGAAMAQGSDSIDALFKTAPEPAPALVAPAPPAPDYASLLGTAMHVDSVAANGAFINGKFYSIGEPIKDFEYPANGRQIVPVIVHVTADSVVVKHGARVSELKA